MQCLMSNMAAVFLPWLFLVQQLPPQVASRGSSPGGIEVSKDWPHSAEQDSWLFVDDDEVQKADLTLVDTLVTTEDAMDHAYWYARVLGVQLSARELACARNGTVRLAGAQGGGCAWLLEQGPCAPSEWLVLREGAAPVCARRPCAPGYGLLAGEARCAPTHQLCAGDRLLAFRYSLRGEGRCHCKGFRALGPDGQCHVLYEQGPCPDGQILMATYSASRESSTGTCLASPCAAGQKPLMSEDGRAITCHAALDCAASLLPLLDTAVGVDVPVCGDSKRGSIRPVARPFSCIRDNRGNCASPRMRSDRPFDWTVELEDRIVFPDRRVAAASVSYLHDYLARYSLVSLIGI